MKQIIFTMIIASFLLFISCGENSSVSADATTDKDEATDDDTDLSPVTDDSPITDDSSPITDDSSPITDDPSPVPDEEATDDDTDNPVTDDSSPVTDDDTESGCTTSSEITVEEIKQAHGTWCEKAQSEIASVDFSSIQNFVMDNKLHTVQKEFVDAKPSIDKKNSKLFIHSFDTTNPSYLYPLGCQIWCKLKKQSQLKENFGEEIVTGAQKSCAAMNESALNWVLENGSEGFKNKYESSGIKFIFKDDVIYERGDQWVSSELMISQPDELTFEITSTSLVSDDWVPMIGGNIYCKLVSPAAMLLLLEQTM